MVESPSTRCCERQNSPATTLHNAREAHHSKNRVTQAARSTSPEPSRDTLPHATSHTAHHQHQSAASETATHLTKFSHIKQCKLNAKHACKTTSKQQPNRTHCANTARNRDAPKFRQLSCRIHSSHENCQPRQLTNGSKMDTVSHVSFLRHGRSTTGPAVLFRLR